MRAGKTIHLLYSCTFHIIEFEFQNGKIRIELGWKKYNINKKFIPHHTTCISMDTQKTVLNILSDRWINPKGKLFWKLIREGYKYADRLLNYLEDIGTMYVGKFELDPLVDFYHSALISPLSILASRADICKNFLISVESAVVGGMSLFTLEKNKQFLLQNLIQMNYSSDNLTTLIRITWEQEETKA